MTDYVPDDIRETVAKLYEPYVALYDGPSEDDVAALLMAERARWKASAAPGSTVSTKEHRFWTGSKWSEWLPGETPAVIKELFPTWEDRPAPTVSAEPVGRGDGWRGDCPQCVASKFTCDAHIHPAPTVSGEVAVKPLEWKTEPTGSMHSAEFYHVNRERGRFYLYLVNDPVSDHATAEAAKAAAQADYERRIRSALFPAPSRAEVLEEPEAMKLLRGPLSRRATSAEFNEWQARDIVEYVDRLRTLGEKP